jgi:hypothetical protein
MYRSVDMDSDFSQQTSRRDDQTAAIDARSECRAQRRSFEAPTQSKKSSRSGHRGAGRRGLHREQVLLFADHVEDIRVTVDGRLKQKSQRRDSHSRNTPDICRKKVCHQLRYDGLDRQNH